MPKKMLIGYFVLLAIFILSGTYSFGAPVISGISGNFNNGVSVIISGSGFGTKSPAAPLVWDNFEGQSVGANPSTRATIGTWDAVQNNGDMHIGSSVVYSGTRAVLLDPTGNGRDFVKNITTGSNTRIYIYLKRRYASNVTTNQKNLYIINENSDMSPSWAWTWNNGGGNIVQPNLWQTDYGLSPDYRPLANIWYTEEFELKTNSGLGAGDGIGKYARNGVIICNNTGVITRNASYPSLLYAFHISNYDGEAGYTIYEDDLYVDKTWSRVIIGNASTFLASTRREIQIPTAWSDSSITVTVNPGSFATGTTVYLYVVDANGNVSTSGHPITVGVTVGAVGQAPSAPIGLRIVN